ncbi:hypothetical protein CDD83_4774 [Cordyceps sp. RAO-2017]|nr:hypothetical protein CDD83_4774 [Cordyceps sp. RAO-2017]
MPSAAEARDRAAPSHPVSLLLARLIIAGLISPPRRPLRPPAAFPKGRLEATRQSGQGKVRDSGQGKLKATRHSQQAKLKPTRHSQQAKLKRQHEIPHTVKLSPTTRHLQHGSPKRRTAQEKQRRKGGEDKHGRQPQ